MPSPTPLPSCPLPPTATKCQGEGPGKKRTRSGCLPCRRRRRKCDGARPSCRECSSRHDNCLWGLKVSFHPSRTLNLSATDAADLARVEERRKWRQAKSSGAEEHISIATLIINETEDVARSCQGATWKVALAGASDDGNTVGDGDLNDAPEQIPSDDRPQHDDLNQDLTDDSLAFIDGNDPGFSDFGPFPSHFSPPNISTSSASGHCHLPVSSFVAPFSLGLAISRGASPEPEPGFPISERSQVSLLRAYLQDTARWCETTDSEMHFSSKGVHAMMESKPFLAAALSLAARQIDTIQGCSRPMTLEMYQYTIRLLLRHDPAVADASILATCTLLCVYEMMGSRVSEWRRHLRGCAGLLRMRSWDGNSKGIVKSCFWAFARIDVWAAFSLDQTTLIPTDSWVKDESIVSVAATEDVDDYCNLAILLFARIINLLNGDLGPATSLLSRSHRQVRKAWSELQEWRLRRPRSVQPLLRLEPSPGVPFPTVIHTQSSPICGNTFYHAGCILLIQSGLVKQTVMFDEAETFDPVWHAKELGGISTSTDCHANWVNHLQPLYIAGRVFGGEVGPQAAPNSPEESSSDSGPHLSSFQPNVSRGTAAGSEPVTGSAVLNDYATEKIAILKHLAKIEKETGWKTSERAKDLRVLWKLEL